ncbi:MAG TPA: NAD-dependent succinate-semialdehyde dehydrogenase [Kofleriaceae bacterium]|jgi:succinate-semialdehyde dehydrogenase/glutarate-semialdehyde dehydrogenase
MADDIANHAFVSGRWVAGESRFEVRDPFDGALITSVTDASDALVDEAVAAAATTFSAWRAQPGPARGAVLRKMAERMLAEEPALALLCTRENGKPLAESAAEVKYAASFLAWFAGEAERGYGETIPSARADQRMIVTREPVGPVALITPWNFPYAMLTRKLGAALAAGCTVVAKPPHQTPLGTLAIAKLADECGLPAGVFNVVPALDGARVGGRLAGAKAIRKISFTGSTKVGMGLMRNAADDLKRVSLELGGNAPFVVLADADVAAAVEGALVAKFRNSGQTCVAAQRFILEAPIADAFTDAFVGAVAKLKVGRGTDAGVKIGPMIDDASAKKISRLARDAVERGARIRFGAVPDGSTRLVAPLVLDRVTPEMALWREEIFGPIVALRTASDEADAIAQANDTDAGLVAYVYTRDGSRQARLTAALEAGMVGVNEGLVSAAQAPFGGVKHSGLGREGSRHGVEDYTSLKYACVRV